MPINRTGLAHAVASTSQMQEASTSQVPPRALHPDPHAVQPERAAQLDLLSALPRGPRHEIVRRLGPRSMARLGQTSREMAATAREGMQAFLEARPRYDPSVDFGVVTSADSMHAALQAVTHFPYPDDEDHDEQRLRGYGRLAARIPSLPQAQRFEAFTAILNHASRHSGDLAFRVLARLTYDVGSLPEELRALAFHAILPSLVTTRRQAQQAAAAAAQQVAPGAAQQVAVEAMAGEDAVAAQGDADAAALGAVLAQEGAAGGVRRALPFRLLARAISQLPEAAVTRAIAEAVALQSGSPLLADATLRFYLVKLEPIYRFQQAYAHLAEHLARSDNGVESLSHLAALLGSLPDPGMRQAAFRQLTRAVHLLSSTDGSATVLRRLAGALPQQPAAVRYLCSLDVLAAADDLFHPSEQIHVIGAVREQAGGIPNHAVALIARCDEAIAAANMMLAASSSRQLNL